MASENEQHQNGANGNSNGAPSRETVFLLDDDASVLKSTDRLLRAAGLEVKAFNDPHAFLQDAERVRPRVAVIDIWMPVMDGLEVQKRLSNVAPETRVIVLTSNDDCAVRTKAMNGGASAFFLKPPNDDDFVNHIEAELKGA